MNFGVIAHGRHPVSLRSAATRAPSPLTTPHRQDRASRGMSGRSILGRCPPLEASRGRGWRATYPRIVVVLDAVLTCPSCGVQATESMPEGACQYFYECTGCGARLKPRVGDCCVFCSYGTVACPPQQSEGGEPHGDVRCC